MRSKAVRVVVACVVSAALVILLLTRLDLGRAAARFLALDPLWVGLAALLSLSVLLVRGVRYTALSRKADLRLNIAATAIQVFLNRVTPLRLGELSWPLLLRRHGGEDAARSLVQLVLVRIIDLAVVAAAIVLAATMRAGSEGSPPLLPTLLALVGLAALLVGFRAWMRLGLRFARWIAVAPGLRRIGALERVLGKLAAAVSDGEALSLRQHAVVAGTSLAVFLLQMVMFGAILEAFAVHVPALALAQGGAVAQAGAAVPIAAVGSIGPQEASWVAGFVWVGVPLEDAIVSAIGCQVITLAFAALFALPAWMWLGRQAVVAEAA